MEAARAYHRGPGRPRVGLLSLAAIVVVGAAALTSWVMARAQPMVSPGPGFPAHHFAPYVDTSLGTPVNLTPTAQQDGDTVFTLAFILSGGSGCQPPRNR